MQHDPELAASIVFKRSKKDILSHSHKPEFVEARNIAIYCRWRMFGETKAHISRIYKRDHTTITHSIVSIIERRKFDFDYDAKCARVEHILSEDDGGL